MLLSACYKYKCNQQLQSQSAVASAYVCMYVCSASGFGHLLCLCSGLGSSRRWVGEGALASHLTPLGITCARPHVQ